MELKVLKTKCNLELPDHLDAYQASDLKDVLLKALETGKPLSVIAQKTERINTTCAQVMMAAHKDFEEKELSFSIEKAPESFLNQLRLIGLDQHLGLEAV